MPGQLNHLLSQLAHDLVTELPAQLVSAAVAAAIGTALRFWRRRRANAAEASGASERQPSPHYSSPPARSKSSAPTDALEVSFGSRLPRRLVSRARCQAILRRSTGSMEPGAEGTADLRKADLSDVFLGCAEVFGFNRMDIRAVPSCA